VRRLLAHLAVSIALLMIALVAVLIAVGFFAVAFFMWLASILSPALAAVVCGGILLFIALILAMIARAILRTRRRRFRADLAEDAALMGHLFGRKAYNYARERAGISMLTALISGFAIGLSPKLRAILLSLLKK